MADGSHFDDMETRPGEGRWAAPEEVWAAVRVDYLAGMSAPEACRRYGVGLSAMRQRAAREGWRRADQPWTPRNRLDPDDEGAELEARVGGDLDKVDLPDLVWVAYRRMMRAVMRGEAVEALRWRRVHAAMEAEQAELDRFIEQEEAIRHMQSEVDAVDASDASDGVFCRPRPSPLAGEGGSRSETEEASRGQDRHDPSSGPSGHLLPQGEKAICAP